MTLPKLNIKKFKVFLKKLPRTFAERAFLTFLGFFLVFLILGGLIFYQYSILVQKREPQITGQPLQFKEKTYQSVLRFWQEREEEFQEVDLKEYLDPFQAAAPTE